VANDTYRVFTQREKEDGKKAAMWQVADLTVDETAGAISFASKGALAKKWEMAFRPDQMTAFTIEMIADTNTLAAMYGGGLLGWGVAALMGRWVKLPVLHLEQAGAEAGNRLITVRGTGLQQRKVTEKIARRLASFLAERGYSGQMPDVNTEEYWKAPTAAILVGCGIVVAAIVLLFACIAIIAALGSN
jgi:hypothetical protein